MNIESSLKLKTRDYLFWSGSTVGGLGFTGIVMGLVTVTPILALAGAVAMAIGSISMIGVALYQLSHPSFQELGSSPDLEKPEVSKSESLSPLEKEVITISEISESWPTQEQEFYTAVRNLG